jgi:GntR family transcriptional regulator/MocR family aminotransferase
VRGVLTDPAYIIVCCGVAQGLGLVGRALVDDGAKRVAVENPSNIGTRGVLRANGLELVAVPVDELGVDVAALERTHADAVLVTPAHQYPTGVVLAPERRAAMLAWARCGRRWIIEDDYDAEFRYDRAPVSAVQGLAPDRVIYVSSVSKTLSPALRLGWIVAPPELSDPIRHGKDLADRGCPTLEACALADFLRRGEYDRHLRRARTAYRRRRDTLITALSRLDPQLTVLGAAAGLHLTLTLPPNQPERDLIERCARLDLAVGALEEQWLGLARWPGVLLGYAAVSEPSLTVAIQRFQKALQEH